MDCSEHVFKFEESYHQILDSISDMVLVKGAHSRLLWANSAFCKHYGMTNEELRRIIDAPFNRPDYTQHYVQDDAYVFNSGKVLDIPVEPVTRFDGVVRYFHTVKSPLRDADGKVVMTIGVSRDITDELNSKNIIETERARSLFASKMAILGEMAGGIAHEINTPLTTIHLAATQIVNQIKYNEVHLEELGHFAEVIQRTTSRIGKIVSGLRMFSRDGSHDPFLPVSIEQLVDDTLAFCRERLIRHGFEVTVEHEDPKLTFECRQAQISQVLLNLINNSFDATERLEQKWIRIQTRQVRDLVELRLTDSGKGISANLVDKIFTPFFTTKELGKGTGLGLSISRGIAESHGGSLTLNQESKNTQFVLTVPKRQDQNGF